MNRRKESINSKVSNTDISKEVESQMNEDEDEQFDTYHEEVKEDKLLHTINEEMSQS